MPVLNLRKPGIVAQYRFAVLEEKVDKLGSFIALAFQRSGLLFTSKCAGFSLQGATRRVAIPFFLFYYPQAQTHFTQGRNEDISAD